MLYTLCQMGFQFAGKVVYSAVWIAAVSLFMELLGFSTKKWLTAGGLGTVLLTLSGREVQFSLLLIWFVCLPSWIHISWMTSSSFFQILTNLLSSFMIHATRPFIVNERIQARIGGYDVSGAVEVCSWALYWLLSGSSLKVDCNSWILSFILVLLCYI